ncbi:MAG: RNA 2',3'-cyclic phosphodiesterase [Nitrososphaerota archaeon]|jgi:2'-5' RNA ligase|nr:RNA 2',3'-cyclic phosphodiesterase [Nitrososphaerota archaeon]
MRLFVALDVVNDEVKRRVKDVQHELLESGANIKPVDPSILHMTLKFIGEVPERNLKEIVDSLEGVKEHEFSLHLYGVGAFPSVRRINVVWVGCSEGGEYAIDLQKRVEAVLSKWGKPERGFVPHLTILRVKGGSRDAFERLSAAVYRHKDDDFGTVQYREFQLKKSVLLPSGPVYETVRAYSLV